MASNTPYWRRAGCTYEGWPSACRPYLQGFNAAVVTGCFPFSTFRSVRRLELSPRSIFGGLSAFARGYIHGLISFSNPGRASRHFFTVSPSDSLTVKLVCQGAARGFATEVETSNVKKVNEDPRGIWSAVDYLTGILIACPGRGYFSSCTPFQYFTVPRTASWRSCRGGVGSNTLMPGSVGADLMLSGVYRTLIWISIVPRTCLFSSLNSIPDMSASPS